MKQTKKSLQSILVLAILTVLVFSTQGNISAQASLQNENQQNDPPLFPGLNWEYSDNVQKDLFSQSLVGDEYKASAATTESKAIHKYYAPEYMEAYGWMLVSDNDSELIFDNEAGRYLVINLASCLDSESYCIYVWQSNDSQSIEKAITPKIGPVGYNKISPANNAIVPLPNNTYHFLTWTDALLEDNYPNDRYQYCIDETNDNTCNSNNWITRDSLYSGGTEELPEFTLVEGHTYYWQVRTRDTLIYANGAATAWWKFTVTAPVAPGFNKISPVHNTTINMPNSTYRLLNWGDAELNEGDFYQYCIDTTNNNACDNNAWINRNWQTLYSGGDPDLPPGVEGAYDFPLAFGQTYYWQVRAAVEGDPDEYTYYYANGNSNTWWKFTIQAILPAPSVVSIVRFSPATTSTNAASVTYRVTFSHDVSGVDASDFEFTATGSVAGYSVTSVNGSGTTYNVIVNTGTGDGTLRLNFDDDDTVLNIQSAPVGGVGINNGDYNSGQAYTIERLAPTVLSTTPATTATPGIIDFTVTFSESVAGVNAADFSLTTTGAVSGAFIVSVSTTSPSNVYTVRVDTGNAGAGTIRLNVIDDDTIKDIATNPLGGVGLGNGNFITGTVFNKSTFADVPTSGSPWSAYESAITSIFNAGITSGCGSGNYCPSNNVTRAEMAVFILKGMFGGGYTPPAATGTDFADVPISHPFAAWIEEFYAQGITSGCGGGNYCPNNPVSRAEMAVFLLRADHGAAYVPPVATGTMFADVPLSHPFVRWIEQLANQGVTSGCGGGNYCPSNAVNRAQMAVFLKKIFSLP